MAGEMPGDERLWVHQVGARDGLSLLDASLNGLLAAAFGVVLYEPAADATDQLAERTTLRRCPTVLVPYALSDRSGPRPLHLTYCPYFAALREPLVSAANIEVTGYDYPLSEAEHVVEQREVEVYRLDELPEVADGRIGAPDVLAIDAPGSEYDILMGAGRFLDTVSAIVVELPYAPRHEGARAFSDVVGMLELRKFRYATSLRDLGAQPFRVPLAFRGNEWRIASTVLLLRSIEDAERDPRALRRLAVIAHLFAHTAYGFECLRRYVQRYGADFGATADGRFLADVYAALDHMPALRTVSFRELYTEEESYARSDPARRDAVNAAAMAKGRRIASAALQTDVVAALFSISDTPVEATFREYGLVEQAELLKLRRRQDIARYFSALGFTVQPV